MLAKSPGDRYQTPTQLLKELDNRNLSREAISVEALAALADEGDAEGLRETATVSQKTRPQGARQPPGPRSLPPKDDRKQQAKPDDDGEHRSPMSLTPLQNALVALAAAVFLALLWWVTTNFASSTNNPNPPPDKNPFEESRWQLPATSTIATTSDAHPTDDTDNSTAAWRPLAFDAASV